MIDQAAALSLLDELRGSVAETEWLDFKSARQTFDLDELGKYVSALANEANLHEQPCGWLIFGVNDRRDAASGLRPIAGSGFKMGAQALNELKLMISQGSAPSVTFMQIIELPHPDCAAGTRVLMFRIPPASRGTPVAWKGHYYGRAGESLVALGSSKFEQIRMQSAALDWTAACVSADWSLLSPEALMRGREHYRAKHPTRADEVQRWDDRRFVSELRLARGGLLTRAVLLLFGLPAALSALDGAAPQLTWRLLGADGAPIDYAHLTLPLVSAIDQLVSMIRIHTVRILPPGQLVPLEVPNYDGWVLREALLNCVAHQDYALGGRIVVTEEPTALQFSNAGTFIPESLERILNIDTPVHLYRNPCLAHAMVEMGLIDTIGSGILRMFRTQRSRHFPMPDFVLSSSPPSVAVRIHGREIDPAFTRALLSVTDLTLAEVIALDHVQKRRPIDPGMLAQLKQRKLVEGRVPNVHIAAVVADALNQRGQYTRNRGLQKPTLKQLVLSLIDKFGKASREEIDQALLAALPSGLTAAQKANRIKNLLSEMSAIDGSIVANRRGVGAVWTRKVPLSDGSGEPTRSDNS